MEKVVELFLRYVKYDTQSNENATTYPSTKGQLVFAHDLAKELMKIGLKDVEVDENGYVMATLPSNTSKKVPTVGFIAHMDTSPDMSGKNVNPKIIENYDGNDIILNSEKNIILSPSDFPELKSYIGHTIIATDGTTLLGADDKAGIAEIITACEYLINHPEIEHGTIRICFTPDEEIGRGVDRFDVKKFNADVAYTVDGGAAGGIEYENFNAAAAVVTVNGLNVHPGSAKGKMRNSITIAMEYAGKLPKDEVPEKTEGYQGYYHLNNIEGSVEKTVLHYILRDFDENGLEDRKSTMLKIAEQLNALYGQNTILVEIKDQYYNMKKIIEKNMRIVDIACEAIRSIGLTPKITPIRGGTDGARLSYMGLPTPNIFTGGHNSHGKYEYVTVYEMKKAVETIIKIAELWAKI